MYRLPEGYRRQIPAPFDDHVTVGGPTSGWVWQPDVYAHAAARADDLGARVLLDVGCGAARKLLGYGNRFELVGIDRAEIIWQVNGLTDRFALDLDAPNSLPVTGDELVICSDVIEHMIHPEHLAAMLRGALGDGARAVILSTPDRERTRGRRPTGPPPNRCHAQEWSLGELVDWLTLDIGLKVAEADWTRSNDHEPDLATCLIELVAV